MKNRIHQNWRHRGILLRHRLEKHGINVIAFLQRYKSKYETIFHESNARAVLKGIVDESNYYALADIENMAEHLENSPGELFPEEKLIFKLRR